MEASAAAVPVLAAPLSAELFAVEDRSRVRLSPGLSSDALVSFTPSPAVPAVLPGRLVSVEVPPAAAPAALVSEASLASPGFPPLGAAEVVVAGRDAVLLSELPSCSARLGF